MLLTDHLDALITQLRLSGVATVTLSGGMTLAQAVTGLSPEAGWVGTGLLGLVLTYVFTKLIPDMLKELREKDLILLKEREADRILRDKEREANDVRLQKIIEHCNEEMQEVWQFSKASKAQDKGNP